MKTSIKKIALVSAIAAISVGSASAATYSSRIIGGADAPTDTYPWMVSVQSKEDGEHFCGGSLIAGSYVLTAAHCVEDIAAGEIQVVVSEFDLANNGGSEETIDAKNVYVHEAYGDENDNDIAIIELSSATSKSPVQLADTSLMNGLSTGTNLTVMGWGNTSSDGENYPDILKEVQVPLADHQQCKTNYENVGIEITSNMICAGLPEGGKDSCQGDSGGPLVYQKDSNWFQTGVVSFGEGCAEKDYFGVYTKVSDYGDWISKVQAGEIAPFVPEENEEDDLDEYADWEDYTDWEDDDLDGDDLDSEHGEWGEHEEYEDGYEDEELQAFEIPVFVDFLATDEDETVEESIFVFNTNEEPLSIQGVMLDNDQHFSVVENACDSATLNEEEECEIVLAYSVTEDEHQEANLTISTSDADHASIEVALFGEVFDELELEEGFDGMDGMDDEEWFFEGDEAWAGNEDDGTFTLAADAVGENDEAMLMTMLEGPGVLEFDMSLTGDTAGNTLSFVVDGEVVTSLSSERANKSHSVELSEGEHDVAWIYSKTEQNTAGAIARISDIEFEHEDASDDYDDAADEDEGELDSDGIASALEDEETQEVVQNLADAISGAGSSDALFLALLAGLGLTARARRK